MEFTRVLKIKLQLDGTDVWRTFLIYRNCNFRALHNAIQMTMGREDAHLFEFKIKDISVMPEDEDDFCSDKKADAKAITLDTPIRKLLKKGDTFQYIYDFGDYWIHTLKVEDDISYDVKDWENGLGTLKTGKAVECIDGAKNCPPEDVGGVECYLESVKSMKAKNKNYKDNLEWFGSDYYENYFDVKVVNKKIAKEF